MAWGDNGVTNRRILLDQAAAITWGNNFLRVPFRAFNPAGYLSRVRLKFPITAATLAETAGVTVAAQAAIQRPAYRAINQLSIVAQGIAPLYQLGRGLDLALLEYVRNGEPRWMEESLGALQDTPATSVGTFGRTSASQNAFGYDVSAGAQFGAGPFSQNVRYGAVFDLPITEWVRFPASIQQGQNGPVTIPAQEVEVGLLTLQSTQQNIVPQVQLNPLYSATVDSPFLTTGGTPTGSLATTAELSSEFYDVPARLEDQPPAYSQMFVISRTSVDDGVSGGNVTHTFQQAGLLMRAIYCFLDASGNLVDVSAQGLQALPASALAAQGTEGTITFKWGATVLKSQERFTQNIARAFRLYGEPPPVGTMYHDFFADRTVTDMINTATLTGVQTQVTGLPGNVATLHTIEERMIPVRQA